MSNDYTPGTREHAEAITEGRHPGVRDALQWLTYSHLPPGLQDFSTPFYQAATQVVRMILTDSPELTTALNKLIEAKDSAVRAGIKHITGRAGSVPRPATVVYPPTFDKPSPRANVEVTAELGSGYTITEDGEVSDGYHTFGELYTHRRALTAALCRALPLDSWKSCQHHPDGDPMFPGYFIVGINLPTGTITYHYKRKYWNDFSGVEELEYAPKWDGAPPAATVTRLLAWANSGA